ncbi:four helix bundle protein [Sphingobacterium allocomposti]|uniref:Four helix bundle protein n=1 Tax=Sphingobacterium allocomposti TaxID=415956 RepID=A0A5S5DIV7_9SPHI|nr:four helix bundle protein [Sphingobacterium composti Yoo et al. 2007 non Ten et al. 2007]TYP95890.1 four helix bundle protein [Sphingobacterium composti Yoo et al. 2007 non Ten et al. 2007]
MTATRVDIKHRAYDFAKQTVLFVGKQEYKHIYHSLIDQLLRSSASVGANLVEGYAGSSKNDFIKFYTIALKSANESKFWLCLLRDTIWKEHEGTLNRLLNEANEISKILASIIIKTKENSKKKMLSLFLIFLF